MKDPKTKWDDDELQQMIQLKNSGLTHKAVAVGLSLDIDLTRMNTDSFITSRNDSEERRALSRTNMGD